MLGKHITNRSARHRQKRRPGEAIEEASDDHCSHVWRHSAGDHPNDKHQIRPHVDLASAVEL